MKQAISVYPMGMTVTDLKELIADWPEKNSKGEPTMVYLEDGHKTAGVNASYAINQTTPESGKVDADLYLENDDF